MAAASAPPSSPPWRRVLYEVQPYPDNYVDQTFLASVLTSTPTHPLDLLALAKDSLVVAQQLSTVRTSAQTKKTPALAAMSLLSLLAMPQVALYCAVYLHVYYGRISASVLIALEALLLLGGWLLRRHVASERLTVAVVRSDARQLILLVGWLLCISPVLATLTRTFSDDTICALTISLFLVHLALHDYEYALNYSAHFRGSISMNAAIFASVLLAARLPSTPHVFAIMTLATHTFVLLPAQSRRLSKALSSAQHLSVASLIVLLTAAVLLLTVSKLLAACYLLAILTISGLCPMVLVRMQHSRAHISGPWDEAVRAFLLSQGQEGLQPERPWEKPEGQRQGDGALLGWGPRSEGRSDGRSSSASERPS